RGDVVLLTAPLGGPPSDVFFEGRATIHGIALARTKDAPAAHPPRPIEKDIEHPAELTWTATHPEIAKPERSANGSLLFVGDELKQRAECFAPLPASGLNEVVLELADLSPGAGVYLGRTDGKPGEVARFFHDRKSGQLAVRLGNDNEEREADFDSPADKFVPLAQPHCWVRLLYGCGNLRWWLSSDGVHWAQTEPARDNLAPGIASIGLSLAANCPDARLTLKRIVLRRLVGLSSLANNDLVERAPAIVTAKSLAEWLPETLKHKPAEIETPDWLRACTIRTLGGGAVRELAYVLLEALLDDAANRGLPVEQQLAALDDAMLMALDLRDGQAMRAGILSRYPQLGVRAAEELALPAWSTVRDHYHAAPANTWMQMPTDLDRVIRWELVSDTYRREPHATLDFLSRLRFFQQHRERPMVEWVEWLASHDVSGRAGESVARLKDSWREPLVEELSKDTYNALTELKAVLESESWDDAARLVTSLDPVAAAGVAPYVNDRTLLTSLPVAVQLTLDDYPHVRQALGDKFAALARLRISQAINVGDVAAIELTTVQFAGTPAAAEAHRWLGDRALVAGHFARAITEYERACGTSPALDEVMPRIRLAAAMQGRDAGSPVTQSVQFGDVSMSPAKFETLIAEMRSRGSSSVPAGASGAAESVPKPTAFESYVRSRLDGPVGDRPQEEVGRRTNQHRVPWADRQIATVVESDVMYVANRFQVTAYNLASGERIWQSQTPPGQIQRAQEWPMIPMRPLVVGNRIFARLLYSPSPLLVCLEKSSGKLLWVSENREREFLVSDPMFVQGQLVALSIAIEPDQQGLLRYCTLDPQTGEMLRQRELVRLRSTWGARAYCEV
ncbi:MAG TPA: PQQ-binding-like beta-propeller repeat protein, partial [Pirellulaceae bacterium]|nr:PQQ-binding-like beta-propeller repeat protein [Pirellulaceae bacterium]